MSINSNQSSENKNNVLEFIDSNVDNIINDTIGLINIPSVSENKQETKRAMDFVIALGNKLGFNSKSVLNNTVGVIEFGEGTETVGILAHIDVVGINEDENWINDPYVGKLSDGCICGRGAMDDKGPLIASLYAMKAIKESGIAIHKKIQLIIGSQEEVEWTDIKEYVSKFPLPDYGFTPDGEFPLTNREKGYADIHMVFNKLQNKEGKFEIIKILGGTTINVVPSSASAEIRGDINSFMEVYKVFCEKNSKVKINYKIKSDCIKITAEGVATHSCFPQKGINAIVVLCSFLNNLSFSCSGAANLIKLIAENFVDDVYGTTIGLYSESEYVNGEYMHRNVISSTLLNTDKDCYTISYNLRTAYGTCQNDLVNAFDSLMKVYNFTYTFGEYMEPIYVSKDEKFLKALADNYETVSGYKNEYSLAYGTSYAKAMNNFVSFGPVFPEETDYCHEANERINLMSLISAAKIYAGTLYDLVSSTESFL